MSDYLDNLVARTFGLAPVVQPRLASLFEPVSVAANNQANAELESEMITEAAPVAQTAPLKPLTPEAFQQARPAVEPRKPQTVKEAIHSTAPEVPQPPAFPTASQIPAAPQLTQPPMATAFQDEPGAPETRRFVLAKAPEPTDQITPVETREPYESDSWPRIEPRVRKLIDDQLTEVQLRNSSDREPVENATMIRPAPPSPPNTGLIETTSAARPQQLVKRWSAEPASPETISVTIGRVDVRAIFSQQPAARPARSRDAAVNSLDDYLKQRSEGRR